MTEELVAFTDLKDKSPGANILSEIDLAGMAALAAADEWNHLHKMYDTPSGTSPSPVAFQRGFVLLMLTS